ncbi:PhzF family phenazine biosynthesis protein [Svornostia abyssi]|uniref:PhzF family phenazine biosynthesis protein n=1 Tax=Svornostia abyssi TaxID=2898438 RepID=A0ABY5PGT8_9ACTN|nr:PhzF family phenazine biosynthesis protein [Parviterribacteraceae bacterium J379]
MPVQRLSAFTDGGRGGNPAGVLLADAHPEPADMQRIAAEVGYSETAFVAPTGDRAAAVRYFSPEAEVPFCGHATIAAAVALAERDGIGPFTFATAAGEVGIETTQAADGTIMATLTSVATETKPLPSGFLRDVLALLHWREDDLDPALPPAFAYAGAWHLILAVRDAATLADLEYDFDATRALMHAHDLTTLQLVHRREPAIFRSRNPFPPGGVVEDPATGAAAAALGGYLRERGELTPPAQFVIEQGVEMGRPSRLLVELAPDQPGVRVTGTASAISA